jgi:NAD+ synthase (glutamine-hydrolysing)
MHISNREGYLALATGNKSELAVGYCTLYGDMAGGLAVIADLPKMIVYELANYINKIHDQELIPANTINKPPSAELRPDQKDEDSLPPYHILDPILQLYIENNLSASAIIDRGYAKETVDRVIKLVDRAEFKRRQAAPGLRITTRAFGSGRRMPIARSYET